MAAAVRRALRTAAAAPIAADRAPVAAAPIVAARTAAVVTVVDQQVVADVVVNRDRPFTHP